MENQIQKLMEVSRDMRKKAYCPYSSFPVGAALLCQDGTVFTGCNVENASYGLSICAERTAIVKAVSEGFTKFKAIAIASNVAHDFIGPCGACRQFLIEFGGDLDVYLTKGDKSFKKWTLRELLPMAFTPTSLTFERNS